MCISLPEKVELVEAVEAVTTEKISRMKGTGV